MPDVEDVALDWPSREEPIITHGVSGQSRFWYFYLDRNRVPALICDLAIGEAAHIRRYAEIRAYLKSTLKYRWKVLVRRAMIKV